MYWICNIVHQIDTKHVTKFNTIYEIMHQIMHKRDNVNGYSTEIHTIYIFNTLYCASKRQLLWIFNWNWIQHILNKWHYALKRQWTWIFNLEFNTIYIE